MSWLEEHIETFVKPTLATHGVDYDTIDEYRYHPYFAPEELTVIKNAWRSMKKSAKDRQIFLPGRDAFIFEILARRENYPTVFMPECSRMTVRHIAETVRIPKGCFLFDTGFAGSIPRNLRMRNFQLLSYAERDNPKVQVFPRLTLSRSLALKIEKTPKYWNTARMDTDNEISQEISSVFDFVNAALLTIEIYTNSAPKFINRHRPLPHYT